MTSYTPTAKRLKKEILYKYNYFKKRNMLAVDGTFYYSDKYFAKEFECSIKTIKRARQQLEKNDNQIRIITGEYVGKATRYLVLREGDKLSTFKDVKGDSLSIKRDKSFTKESQDVSPNHINNHLNKPDALDYGLFDCYFEQQYTGHKKDFVATRKYFLDLNYSEYEVLKAKERYEKRVKNTHKGNKSKM